MKVNELFEWGRIVKGVNTTPDVDTDEIPRQAEKFGNTVDKDGKPPTLSTKVKGKSTNVLFNLGLFEEKADSNTRKNYNDFAKFCVDTLGIKKFPKITMTGEDLDRTFGYFDIEEQSITVSFSRRHQMDTMRTLAHELVHCKQREEREDLDGSDGSPDENEANAMAGVLLRRWADKNPHLFAESVEIIDEAWTAKYKRSINCNNPRGFSQRAHCAGRNKNESLSNWLKTTFNSDPQFKAWYRMYKEDPKKAKEYFKSKHKEYLSMISENFADGKKKESIQEILAVTNIDPDQVDKTDFDDVIGQTKKVGNIKGYDIHFFESNPHVMLKYHHFLIKDPNSEGFLGELKLGAFRNYWVSEVWFAPEIQGKGLALPLYAYVVKKGYTIVSDREQSKGSQTIWKNLTKVPGIFVYAWDRNDDEFFQWNPEEETDDAIYQDKNDIRLVAIDTKQKTNENFADGKVSGRSRPGRVKRAGASCDGSVSELRRKASNSSGERAKMYHWCANMKAGRQK